MGRHETRLAICFERYAPRPVVHLGEANRATLVQYQTKLPDDIKPMLVLDASARVRATYRQQHRVDNDITLLSEARKRYSRVQVHFEEGGAGKEDFGRRYWQRLNEVADIIKRHPDRKPLVLHHKPDGRARIGNVEGTCWHCSRRIMACEP